MYMRNVSTRQDQTKYHCSQHLTVQFFRDKISPETLFHDLCFILDNSSRCIWIRKLHLKWNLLLIFINVKWLTKFIRTLESTLFLWISTYRFAVWSAIHNMIKKTIISFERRYLMTSIPLDTLKCQYVCGRCWSLFGINFYYKTINNIELFLYCGWNFRG